MSIRAKARHAPPTKYSSRPSPCLSQRIRRQIALRNLARLVRITTGPFGKAGSREVRQCGSAGGPAAFRSAPAPANPPPMPARTPSACGMPHSTPSAGMFTLLVAGQHADWHAGQVGDDKVRTKSGPFAGVAHRGGGEHPSRGGPHGGGHGVVSAHDGDCLIDTVLVKPAGRFQSSAEAKHGLFVEDGNRIAAIFPCVPAASRTELDQRSTTAQRCRLSRRSRKGIQRSVLVHTIRPPVRRQR